MLWIDHFGFRVIKIQFRDVVNSCVTRAAEAGSPIQLFHIPVKANNHVYGNILVLSMIAERRE
jgi:hypothetical protein